jgi:hypothetical protein
VKTHPLAHTLAVFGLVSLACGTFTPGSQAPTTAPTQPAVATPVASAALPVFAAYDELAVGWPL